MRFTRWLVIATFLAFITGCGAGSDKGKNKDKDIPKSASNEHGTVYG